MQGERTVAKMKYMRLDADTCNDREIEIQDKKSSELQVQKS